MCKRIIIMSRWKKCTPTAKRWENKINKPQAIESSRAVMCCVVCNVDELMAINCLQIEFRLLAPPMTTFIDFFIFIHLLFDPFSFHYFVVVVLVIVFLTMFFWSSQTIAQMHEIIIYVSIRKTLLFFRLSSALNHSNNATKT